MNREACKFFSGAFAALAMFLPRLPIRFSGYLDLDRVCREPWTAEQFLMDPLSLHCSPQT